MGRPAQDVTDAELAVLERLWEFGESTIRRLTDALYPDGNASHYATVQKLLDRLEDKGCVARRREGGRHQFQARVARSDLIRRRLQATADKLCGGSVTPLITHLLDTKALSQEDRLKLKDLIERLDGTGTSDGEASSGDPS